MEIVKDIVQRFFIVLNNKLRYSRPIIVGNGHKKIFFSYITRPFIDKRLRYSSSHQNVNEVIMFSQVLKKLGFCAEIYNFDANIKKVKQYDVIFGIEPNFISACLNNASALKIYYATGAYFAHQNSQIVTRTDSFNSKYNVMIPYRRLVEPHISVEIADIILQIGTKETVLTYPTEFRNKIVLLDQSSHQFTNIDLAKKRKLVDRNKFVWFGSSGSILKGLDLVLDYFIEDTSCTLHVFGVIEDDFIDVYKEKLKSVQNIYIHGFVDINSNFFRDFMDQCAFLLYPSASEGCPGSVINAMKLGVIPIVSKWAAPEAISELGYLLTELDQNAIRDSIIWAKSLNEEEISNLIYANHMYVLHKYSLENFRNQLERFFREVFSLMY